MNNICLLNYKSVFIFKSIILKFNGFTMPI